MIVYELICSDLFCLDSITYIFFRIFSVPFCSNLICSVGLISLTYVLFVFLSFRSVLFCFVSFRSVLFGIDLI